MLQQMPVLFGDGGVNVCNLTLCMCMCLICPCLQGNTDPLEQAVGKLQRTKRPDRADLAALLPELQVQCSVH